MLTELMIMLLCYHSDNKTTNNPDIEERRKLFEQIFSLLETHGGEYCSCTVDYKPPCKF